MLVLFGILIIIASVALGFIVLVQNPKGGGLSGTFGGFGNQIMGVKQTTDVLEKGTWIFAAVVGILCLVSPGFIPKDGNTNTENNKLLKGTSTSVPVQQQAPATNNTTVPMPALPDSNK